MDDLSPLKMQILTLRRERKLSSRQIADEVGVTRNVVIGVLARLKRAGHDVPDSCASRANITRRPPRPRVARQFKKAPIEIQVQETVHISPGVLFQDLTYFHCRAIIADGPHDEMHFCGSVKFKRSYCRHHFFQYYVQRIKKT